jgi:hypothetical protein
MTLTDSAPQEPSHRYLRARLGLEAINAHHMLHEVAHEECSATERELSEAWNRLGWTLSDATVSDAELLVQRAALRPKQDWADGLRAALAASFDVMYSEWQRRNPEPRERP